MKKSPFTRLYCYSILITFFLFSIQNLQAQTVTNTKKRSCVAPLPSSDVRVAPSKNVNGTYLKICSTSPKTGFYRTGKCDTGNNDVGVHVVCAEVTTDFLNFSKAKGNDLTRPFPYFGFPGLKAGDKWCLCASRWKEAAEAGVAPPVDLDASHQNSLQTIPLATLKQNILIK